jgi:transcriptional regulator with XRE-family HTH domain
MEKRPPNPRLVAIGQRLEALRTAFDLKQADFAGRAGIQQNTYSQYATGKNLPRVEFAERICDEYGVTLDWIYRGDVSGMPVHLLNLIKKQSVPA